MQCLILALTLVTPSVEYGWQPGADGQLEYIIELEDGAIQALRAGKEVSSDIHPDVVRSVRRFVARAERPQLGRPAVTPRNAPPPAAQYGWQPGNDGQLEYYIQLNASALDAVERGQEISGNIHPDVVGMVKRLVLRVGEGPLPRSLPRASTGVSRADTLAPSTNAPTVPTETGSSRAGPQADWNGWFTYGLGPLAVPQRQATLPSAGINRFSAPEAADLPTRYSNAPVAVESAASPPVLNDPGAYDDVSRAAGSRGVPSATISSTEGQRAILGPGPRQTAWDPAPVVPSVPSTAAGAIAGIQDRPMQRFAPTNPSSVPANQLPSHSPAGTSDYPQAGQFPSAAVKGTPAPVNPAQSMWSNSSPPAELSGRALSGGPSDLWMAANQRLPHEGSVTTDQPSPLNLPQHAAAGWPATDRTPPVTAPSVADNGQVVPAAGAAQPGYVQQTGAGTAATNAGRHSGRTADARSGAAVPARPVEPPGGDDAAASAPRSARNAAGRHVAESHDEDAPAGENQLPPTRRPQIIEAELPRQTANVSGYQTASGPSPQRAAWSILNELLLFASLGVNVVAIVIARQYYLRYCMLIREMREQPANLG